MASEKAHIASTSPSLFVSKLLNCLSVFPSNLLRSVASRFLNVSRYGGGLERLLSLVCSNRAITRTLAARRREPSPLRRSIMTLGQFRRTANWEVNAKRAASVRFVMFSICLYKRFKTEPQRTLCTPFTIPLPKIHSLPLHNPSITFPSHLPHQSLHTMYLIIHLNNRLRGSE